MTPVDWGAVLLATTSSVAVIVKWVVPGIRGLQAPAAHHGNGGTKTLEARIAGGEAATVLSEIRESRRVADGVWEIVGKMAAATERNSELLAKMAALVAKSDERWDAVTESTQAMHRMLQIHTGLLDKTSLQVDAVHAVTVATAPPPKKRRKR